MNTPVESKQERDCTHRYLTSYGQGWVCANRACGIGILSLSVPLPLPLIAEALRAIASATPSTTEGQTK
jgi:hypothetical protein